MVTISLSLLLGDGLGSFSEAGRFAPGTGTRWATVADFDSNGSLDIGAVDQVRVQVLLNTHTPSPTPPRQRYLSFVLRCVSNQPYIMPQEPTWGRKE
jgi:hypothetical protein